MERRRKWLVGGTIGLGLVALVAGFAALFEPYEEEVESGYSGAARTNPLYACELFFTRLGVPARSVLGTGRLPPTDHALVVVAPRRIFGSAQAERLLAWVAEGGHLIVTPRQGTPATARDDPLLQPLGLTVEARPGAEPEVVRVRGRAGARDAEVTVAPSPRFTGTAESAQFAAGPEDGAVVTRFRHGSGWITALADAAFLGNDRIGDYDHARFAWELVTATRRPAGVWLVYRDLPPSLLGLLVGRAWLALVSATVLLVAWLWRRGSRFGPLLPEPPRERRSLVEHVRATGEFLWRHGQHRTLLASERQALLHRVGRRQPGWSRLPRKDLIRNLAKLAGVAPGTLSNALDGHPGGDEAAFTRAVAILERVRRSL